MLVCNKRTSAVKVRYTGDDDTPIYLSIIYLKAPLPIRSSSVVYASLLIPSLQAAEDSLRSAERMAEECGSVGQRMTTAEQHPLESRSQVPSDNRHSHSVRRR